MAWILRSQPPPQTSDFPICSYSVFLILLQMLRSAPDPLSKTYLAKCPRAHCAPQHFPANGATRYSPSLCPGPVLGFGFMCLNREQRNGEKCRDYQIRQCCPKESIDTHTTNNHDHDSVTQLVTTERYVVLIYSVTLANSFHLT